MIHFTKPEIVEAAEALILKELKSPSKPKTDSEGYHLREMVSVAKSFVDEARRAFERAMSNFNSGNVEPPLY